MNLPTRFAQAIRNNQTARTYGFPYISFPLPLPPLRRKHYPPRSAAVALGVGSMSTATAPDSEKEGLLMSGPGLGANTSEVR
ncbi:hypothetical protein DL93DRAFT_2090591, partial [Clavulina sp. PMI_390]